VAKGEVVVVGTRWTLPN